ncbi:MAG: hypothetical protein ABJH06_16950 [Paraglaciecola sp.]|uniref:hypothetical protein n=1 Tax=Paraglaciecola sp. TaxID=1920173 RepID=UPI00329814EB
MGKGNRKKKVSSSVRCGLDYLIRTKRSQKVSSFPKAVSLLSSDIALRTKYNFRPNSITSLSSNKLIAPMSPEREILWLGHLISAHASFLDDYLKLKSIYESCILKGNFQSGVKVLDKLKNKCGYSIWLIEAQFFCYQQINGLEGNKKLLNTIFEETQDEGKFSWVSYISYLISERNEDINDFDFIRYKHTRALDDVESGELKEQLLAALYYFIFDYVNFESNNIQSLLNVVQNFSIIDIYNCVIRLLTENQFRKFFSNSTEVVEILPNLEDLKLLRLKLLHSVIYEIHEKETEQFGDFDNVQILQPEYLNPLFKIGKFPTSENEFINKYLENIRGVILKEDNFEQNIQYINYIALNLKHIDSSYSLVLIPKELIEGFNNYINAGLSFIYSKFLPESEQTNLIKKFCSRITDQELQKLSDIESIEGQQETSTNSTFSEYSQLKLHKKKLETYLGNDEKSKAFELLSSLISENEKNTYFFDLHNVCASNSWKQYKSMGNYSDILIVLASYLSFYNDDKQQFNLTASLRTFLRQKELSSPSELCESDFNFQTEKHKYFLNKVCSSFNLSQDSYSFSQPREIVIERLAICEKLKSYDESSSLLEEIEELERKLAITDGLQEVDSAGLNVDQLRFFKECNNKYLKMFDRYKALKELTALPLFQNSSVVSDENSLFKSTLQESISIIRTILIEMSDIFLKHEEFGLDYYLSMRIRHGRFMGITRGPLERNKLVTKYSSEINGYLDNTFWSQKLTHKLKKEESKKLNEELAKFSSDIDESLTEFKDKYIQIYSDEKPFGVFSINLTANDILNAHAFIKESTSLDDFLEYVMELFVANLEQCSNHMKSLITFKLLTYINDKTYQLQSNMTTILDRAQDRELSTKIISARTEMNNVLSDLTSWFNISGENKKFNRTYSFTNIVDIALAKTKRVHPHFTPNLSIKNESTIEFHSNLLGIIVDAFDIMFSNIFEHGKMLEPDVSIFLSEEKLSSKNSKIVIEVTNPISEKKVDFEKLKVIENEINSQKLKTKEEDGSGFHKLLALPFVENNSDLEFGHQDDLFRVKLVFTLTLA